MAGTFPTSWEDLMESFIKIAERRTRGIWIGGDGYPFWGTLNFLKKGGGGFQEFFHFHFVDGPKWSKFHTITKLGKLIYLFNGNITMLFTFTKFSGEKHKFH